MITRLSFACAAMGVAAFFSQPFPMDPLSDGGEVFDITRVRLVWWTHLAPANEVTLAPGSAIQRQHVTDAPARR
jgi:hypothetical protein